MSPQIAQLAKEMNCSYADMQCLAVGVAQSIKADKAADVFINTPEMQIDLCHAYVASEVRKFDCFVSEWLSNPTFKSEFLYGLFNELKAGATA